MIARGTNRLVVLCAAIAGMFLSTAAHAWPIYMPDSTNNRIVSFDENTGAVINPNVFALQGGTPQKAIQVGNEIWVTEQIGDRVGRYDLNGLFLGALGPTTPGLDNVRGLTQIGNVVYVCSTGTNNGAGGKKLQKFDPSGTDLGSFPTAFSFGFDILPYQGVMLVSSDTANDDIHKYGLNGEDLGTFHNSTTVNFVEQLNYATNGDVLAATFTSNMVFRLDPNNGNILSSFAASGSRGVIQLGNGNILWSSGSGAFVRDAGTGVSTQVYTGGGRMFSFVPEPATLVLCLAGALTLVRRKRR